VPASVVYFDINNSEADQRFAWPSRRRRRAPCAMVLRENIRGSDIAGRLGGD
jgi:hypothetical protein